MTNNSFTSNVFSSMVRNIFTIVIGLGLLALLTNTMSASEFGRYTLLSLLPVFIFQLLNFGIGSATIYYVAKGTVSISRTLSTNFILGFLTPTLACILFVGFITYSNLSVFSQFNSSLLYVYGLTSVPLFLNSYIGSILQGKEDFVAFNYYNMLGQFCLFLGIVFLIYMDLVELGYIGVLYFFSLFITTLFIIRYTLKFSGRFSKPSLKLFQLFIKYGKILYGCNILAFLSYKLDIFLVAYFMGPASVAYYFLAQTISERIWIIPASVATVLYPKSTTIFRIDKTRGAKYVVNSIKFSFWFSLIIVSILVLCAKSLIPLAFGNDYIDTVEVIYYLFPSIVFGSLAKPVSAYFSGLGNAGVNFRVSLLSLILNIVLNVILIPTLGLVGAAISSSISYTFNGLYKSYLFTIATNTRLKDLFVLQRRDINTIRNIFLRAR